jgi:glutamine amidotransferase
MSVAVIDYGAGNLRSAARALTAAGAADVRVTGDPAEVARAARIVLPGVGAFGHCIGALRSVPGMVAALEDAVRGRGVPFLGICVGMQLLADTGHEHGVHQGLGWIGGSVRRMAPDGLKVPQIGWNQIVPTAEDGDGWLAPGWGYFVHSYAFEASDPADIAASADYGGLFPAALRRGNIFGVQFHPEKSQRYGLALLSRWLVRSD